MKNKISYKLIVLIFFISILVTSISTYIQIQVQYEEKIESFEKSLDNIEKNQLPLLVESLWKVDYAAVNIFLNNLVYSEKIIYADVIENNKIVGKAGILKNHNTIKKEFKIVKEINNETYDIGTLTLLADLTPLYKDIESNIKGIILTEIVKVLLLSVLIIFVMKKILTTPLEIIANFAKEFSLKDLNQPLNIEEKNQDKYNELDIVSHSINTMRLNLLNQIKERETLLNKHNEQLKEKIVERDNEIGARKKAEKKILKLNETLEAKVNNRTKELKQQSTELEKSLKELKKTQETLIESQKMASLGALVAGVAHEINTPIGLCLTGITHFISTSEELTKKYEKNELTEEGFKDFIQISNELAKSININLEKTAHLVKSFKEIAVDQSKDEKREFNIKEYIKEVLLSISNITKKTNIQIHIKCDDSLSIHSYPGVISQIITKLIINSLKHAYTNNEKNIIDIIVKEKNKNITILFKDYGKGISKINLSKIFDPFFTTNREDGGSGLGLSIIYNLVTTKLNGTITCESEENKGTTFRVSFDSNKNI